MSPYRDPNELNDLLELLKKEKDFIWASFGIEKIFRPRVASRQKARWMTNDLEALIALVSKDWLLSLEDVLPTITMPCLLFVGEADRFYPDVKKCADSMLNATFVSFPNLGHIETLYRSDLVIPYIKKFLAGVN